MSSSAPDDPLAVLARELAAATDVDTVWRRVVDASVEQIDGAHHAGITVIGAKSVSTPVCSDALVEQIDQHQYASGEGPCLQAAVDEEPVVRVDDLRTDQRWPTFAAGAVQLGVESMLCFQLYTERETIGALNIYAEVPGAFTADSVRTGVLLATQAALAVAATLTEGNLRTALANRDVIGQAKGILMERYKITAEQAFDLLIAASQRTHRKLHDVATELASSGVLSID